MNLLGLTTWVSTMDVSPQLHSWGAAEPRALEHEADRLPDRLAELPGWSLLGLGAVVVCAAIWANVLTAGECRTRPLTLALGSDANASITMTRDVPCTILLQIGSAALDDLVVQSRPENGSLTPRGRTGVVYRPDPRFRGEDNFAFAVQGRLGAIAETSVVRVHAVVK
jgi:hypothetical protein